MQACGVPRRVSQCPDPDLTLHLVPERLTALTVLWRMRAGAPRATLAACPTSATQEISVSTSNAQSTLTPLGAVVRGIVAGAVGTAAMDVLLFARYRRGGGDSDFAKWEFSSGLASWDNAPAPALVGKGLVEGLFKRQLSPQRAALVNNVTHWAFGMFGGAQYGIIAGSLRTPRVLYGVPFGASVWGTGYAVLPAAKLYKPIWDYHLNTLAKDLSAHLVYGVSTASVLRLLSAPPGPTA